MNAILKYPGSKWRIADWIFSFFPEHHTYLEPFFGSGALLFRKPRSAIETVNDRDDQVVNLYEWIKKDPERLARELHFIPYSRSVYERTYRETSEDSLQKAVNFLIRCNMGHGFRTTGERVGFKSDVQGREKAYAAKYWCELPQKLFEVSERLRGVQIENQPAVELIRRYNYQSVLIYADPPYLPDTRHGPQYRYEMSLKDHVKLLDVLLLHKGPVMVSGYGHPLYEELLKGWHREERTSCTQSGKKRTEVIWMNFLPVRQLSLFEKN